MENGVSFGGKQQRLVSQTEIGYNASILHWARVYFTTLYLARFIFSEQYTPIPRRGILFRKVKDMIAYVILAYQPVIRRNNISFSS
jgi:hypothetical protein